jgi:beta-xylosidase
VAYGEDLHNLTVVEEPIINTEDNTLWSGTIGRRDVIFCGGYYYMVYEISTDQGPGGGYNGAQWTHMFARSTDLINWEICSGPLLTQGKAGMGYDGTCWMVVGKKLYVYMRAPGNSTTAVELVLNK